VIAVESEEEWKKFCELTGHREWTSDSRFAHLSARITNRSELDALVESWTRQYTPHQVMIILQRDGIAAGIVQTAEDLYRDPHLRERGFARERYVPEVGWLAHAGPAVRLTHGDVIPEEIVHGPGEDNEAVFGELLGLSRLSIQELMARDVLR
jgi:crotonobetainyl-CoA:carnitine CoA-transferase CaiB-like acyl-CoA transferase